MVEGWEKRVSWPRRGVAGGILRVQSPTHARHWVWECLMEDKAKSKALVNAARVGLQCSNSRFGGERRGRSDAALVKPSHVACAT